jgi:outer membrane protein assembly factor BamB
VLDVCSGDDAALKMKDWPTGTEVHNPSPRFEGLQALLEVTHVTGGLSRARVEPLLDDDLGGFRGCYEKVFKDSAMDAVEMSVHMAVVDVRGATADVSVQSDSAPAALASCVTTGLRIWTSWQPLGARGDVTFALRFVPPAGAAAGKPPEPTAPGAIRWSQPFRRTMDLRIDDLAVDGQGRVIAAGTVKGPMMLESVSLAPHDGATPFFVRLDPQGHVVGGALVDALPHGDAWLLVAAGPGDDVVVAGPADNQTRTLPVPAPNGAPFLARIGPDGAVRWSRPLPVERVTGLAGAAGGAVVFAAIAKEPPGAGGRTSIVARWSADGAPVWQKALGDETEAGFHLPAIARGVAIDSGGAVIVAGTVAHNVPRGHLDLGQGPVNQRGESGFVAKFAPDGQVLWSQGMPYAEPYAVAAGGDAVAMIGEAGCGPYKKEPFVVALDGATGAERWARWMPEIPHKERRSVGRVAVATDGAVAFTEWAEGPRVVGSVDRSGAGAWSRIVESTFFGPDPSPALVATPSGFVLLPTRNTPFEDVGRIIGLVK